MQPNLIRHQFNGFGKEPLEQWKFTSILSLGPLRRIHFHFAKYSSLLKQCRTEVNWRIWSKVMVASTPYLTTHVKTKVSTYIWAEMDLALSHLWTCPQSWRGTVCVPLCWRGQRTHYVYMVMGTPSLWHWNRLDWSCRLRASISPTHCWQSQYHAVMFEDMPWQMTHVDKSGDPWCAFKNETSCWKPWQPTSCPLPRWKTSGLFWTRRTAAGALQVNQWWARSRKKESIRAIPTLGALRKVPKKQFCRCKLLKNLAIFLLRCHGQRRWGPQLQSAPPPSPMWSANASTSNHLARVSQQCSLARGWSHTALIS